MACALCAGCPSLPRADRDAPSPGYYRMDSNGDLVFVPTVPVQNQ